MRIEDLHIGENIELEVKSGGRIMSFPAQIMNIIDNSVLISVIKSGDQTLGFENNCHVSFLYKEGSKITYWENICVRLIRYDEILYHQVLLEGDGKSYNRREAFRLYIGEDMALHINTSDGPTAITVLVKDISELGVAFITNEDIDVERTFRLKLRDANTMLTLNGIIIRKEFLPNLNSYIYGCKFYKHNDLLGRFIAKKQCEKLRSKKLPSSPRL